MDTLGSIRAEILGWLRGDYATDTDLPLVNAAINDATEDIWNAMMPVALARFFGLDSPVSFTLPSGAERVQLVAVADPTTQPSLFVVAGGNFGIRNVTGAYTYVTESGAETLPSPTNSENVGANNLVTAALPSTANILNAIGWNFYAAIAPDTILALQNQQPIPFGVTWQEPLSGIVDYPTFQQTPGVVQGASQVTPLGSPVPSENTTADNISWITHMEVRTSDTLLRSWNQYDIDSELMRRYGRQLSSASEYQTYVWEIINGNRLEFRPSAGQSFTPRYFYVAKPRRLRYDQGTIPYTQIPGVHEYIVNKAVSRLKLGVEEYAASQAWGGEAATVKAGILSALTQEVWSKNTRIAPHLFIMFI